MVRQALLRGGRGAEALWALGAGSAVLSLAGGFTHPQGSRGAWRQRGGGRHQAFRRGSPNTAGGGLHPRGFGRSLGWPGSLSCLGPRLVAASIPRPDLDTLPLLARSSGTLWGTRCVLLTLTCLFSPGARLLLWGRGSLGAAMAPSHLSVREMREDEKPLVLEMLKVRDIRSATEPGGLVG